MSKKRNTGITDKWGFWHTCYITTATQSLKDIHNSGLRTYREAKIKFWLLDDYWPDCVAMILSPQMVEIELNYLMGDEINTYGLFSKGASKMGYF